MRNAPYHSQNRKWNYIIPCFDISSHFLLPLAVLIQPSSRQDCPGWGSPLKAAKLGKGWGSASGEWGLHSSQGTQPPRWRAGGKLSSSGSVGTMIQPRGERLTFQASCTVYNFLECSGSFVLYKMQLICSKVPISCYAAVVYRCTVQLFCTVVWCSCCVQFYNAAVGYFTSRLCIFFLNAQCPV